MNIDVIVAAIFFTTMGIIFAFTLACCPKYLRMWTFVTLATASGYFTALEIHKTDTPVCSTTE